MKDKRHEIIEALRKDAKPVLIYGTGKFAVYVAEYVLVHGISVLGFVDTPEYYYKGKKIKIKLDSEEKLYQVYEEKKLTEIPSFFEWGRLSENYKLIVG